MITDSCSWDHPGTDRYTGSIPAAIGAYGFPQATQQALIAAFEARQFNDRVVITRDEIRGEHGYEPEVRAMHFGSRGVICGTVTRARWAAGHVERALVFCAEGECLAWPSVCGNLFRITPRAPAAGTLGEGRLPPFVSSGGVPLPIGVAPAPDVAGFAPAPAPLPPTAPAVSLAAPGSFGEGTTPTMLAPAAVPTAWATSATLNPLGVGPQAVPATLALPEPGTWLSLLSGLALVAGVVRRRTR